MKIKRLPKEINLELARDFGYIIRDIRLECGLSQEELAKMVGLKSGVAISLYESNSRDISAQMLFKICSVCGYVIDIIENEYN